MLGNGGDWSKAPVVPGRPQRPLLTNCGSAPTPASAQPEPQLRFVYNPSSHDDSHASQTPSAASSTTSNDRGPWFALPSVAEALDAEAEADLMMIQRSDSSSNQRNVPLRPAPGRKLRASEGIYNGTQGCPDWNELFPDRPPPQDDFLPLLTTSAFSQSQPPLQPTSRDEASQVPTPRPPPIHRPPSIQQQRGNRPHPPSRPVTTQAQPQHSSQQRPTRPPPPPPHARVMRHPGARAPPVSSVGGPLSTRPTRLNLSQSAPVSRVEQPRPRPPSSKLPATGNPSATSEATSKETLEKAKGTLEKTMDETAKKKDEKEECKALNVRAREVRRDWGECCICFQEAQLDHALLPCGHVIACEPCLGRVWNNGQGRGSKKPKCPACNADILKPPHKLYFG